MTGVAPKQLFRTSLATAGRAAVVLLIFVTGCGEADDPYVGVMSDTSYGGQVTAERTKHRVSANGRKVAISGFRGRYVWADSAAPWCSPCIPQSQTIRRLQDSVGESVIFLTVMTSETPGHADIPDQGTALSWSKRFGLNPDHVVAAKDQYGRIIPSHMLFSPEGHTLYAATGLMSESQIREVLTQYMRDWDEWSQTAHRFKWMRD
jgi:thiol-disulfide isomerase/thioredoxin